MNLDQQIREADARVQQRIDERAAHALARIRFQFAHARRSSGQRLCHDNRERVRHG